MRRTRGIGARLVGVALVVSAAGCGSDTASPTTEAPTTETRDPLRQGPQGNVAQFVVECEPSHLAYDDPIVFPDRPGESHLHQFFGNRATSADPDPAPLLGSATSCERRSDTASYWAPALLDGTGRVIEAIELTAYYRPGPGVDPASVEPYPPGLKMIAGDARASEPQPLEVVAWGCGTGSLREPTPPNCEIRLGESGEITPTNASTLRLWITFPDCWDGHRLTTGAAGDHVTRSDSGACPDSHPVAIPQLQMAIDFPAIAPEELSLASGGIETAHADFWNVWDQAALEREVRACLNRDLVCGVTG